MPRVHEFKAKPQGTALVWSYEDIRNVSLTLSAFYIKWNVDQLLLPDDRQGLGCCRVLEIAEGQWELHVTP